MPRIAPIPWEAITPAQRQRFEHSISEGGSPPDKTASRILIYAEHDHVPDDGDRHYNYPKALLGGRLMEMLRIRSAQLGGCDPCMNARKVDGVDEEVVVCLANPALRDDLTERERLALNFLDLLATDHHAINDDTYRALAKVFTTAEIVELGTNCGHMIGSHRFIHTLDPYGDGTPVIDYDPAQVGVTWEDVHGPSGADSAR